MAHSLKVLATMTDDLGSILRTHIKQKLRKQILSKKYILKDCLSEASFLTIHLIDDETVLEAVSILRKTIHQK